MNAVERMVEYTSQPTEESKQKSAWPPPQDWPHAGGIVIDNLQVIWVSGKCFFPAYIPAAQTPRPAAGFSTKLGQDLRLLTRPSAAS